MFQIRSLLWLAPFASFFLGYTLICLLVRQPALPTPAIVGKTIDQAVMILSEHNLNIRIVGQKDDAQLPDGTILSQTPAPGTKIKEQQAMYVTISKKVSPRALADLVGTQEPDALLQLEKLSLSAKVYKISSHLPAGTIIAQHPQAGTPVTDNTVILYSAESMQKPLIMPNFKGILLDEVLSFLSLNGITPSIIHVPIFEPDHRCTHCRVLDQRPLAGSFVKHQPEKPLQIQLQIG